MKIAARSFLLVVAFSCAARACCAADGSIVEIPTAQTTAISGSGQDITSAAEYKSTRNVIDQEKQAFWNWYFYIGYESQYNFRGTNLTPDADGAGFIDVEVTKWGFTLGVYDIRQFGTARSRSFSIGEGGGGGTTALGFTQFLGVPVSAMIAPETIQGRFNEIDVFLQYHTTLGPVDLTVGNIGFFIQRDAKTFITLTDIVVGPPFFISLPGPFKLGPLPSVEDEKFDRVFIRLTTSKIPHIQPEITYYQTILNTGQQPSTFHIQDPTLTPILLAVTGRTTFYHGGERNEALGGYLEGRLRGNFPIADWVSFNPYGVISASFHDRSERVVMPVHRKDGIKGRSLSGFNHAQVGVELPIRLWHKAGDSTGPYSPPEMNLYLTPFGAYAYHISEPTPSTNRNEEWGGAKFVLTF